MSRWVVFDDQANTFSLVLACHHSPMLRRTDLSTFFCNIESTRDHTAPRHSDVIQWHVLREKVEDHVDIGGSVDLNEL